jgi:hypothetical protein
MIRWSYGICMFSERNADGFIGYQPDYYGEKESGGPPLESCQPYGFLSRPNDPDIDPKGNPVLGAGLLYFHQGGEGFAQPTQDPRDLERLPTLQPGESMVYGSRANFVKCYDDGAVMMFTTDDGTEDGRSIYAAITPTGGFEYSSPWGRITAGPLGLHMLHSSGARLDLGSIGGMPAPFDTLASYAKLEAAIVSIKGGVVSLGTDGGAGNEAAVTSLQTLASAINTALVTISTTPCVVGSPVLTPVQAAAVTTALNAFLAIAAAIGKVV